MSTCPVLAFIVHFLLLRVVSGGCYGSVNGVSVENSCLGHVQAWWTRLGNVLCEVRERSNNLPLVDQPSPHFFGTRVFKSPRDWNIIEEKLTVVTD